MLQEEKNTKKIKIVSIQKKCGHQFTHSRNEIKKKESRGKKRKLNRDNVQEVDHKIQILDVDDMAQEQLHNISENIDEINIENNDGKT